MHGSCCKTDLIPTQIGTWLFRGVIKAIANGMNNKNLDLMRRCLKRIGSVVLLRNLNKSAIGFTVFATVFVLSRVLSAPSSIA